MTGPSEPVQTPAGSFAVMFHHFHGEVRHPRSQGSIDADAFRQLLRYLQRHHRLLTASDYLERVEAGGLSPTDTCLTFDDALLSQYEIAAPVMDDLGLTAFFFVYTSIFTDRPDRLEIYRDFRTLCFEDIDQFYTAFFDRLEARFPWHHGSYQSSYSEDYLAAYPFYSEGDRRFRFVRDRLLKAAEYDALMDELMAEAEYPLAERRRLLWMSGEQVAELASAGHEIGLHSHTHPIRMDGLASEAQAEEYARNHRLLSTICGRSPRSMSHPCGRYNEATLAVLQDLGIRIGFRSSLEAPPAGSPLELPREDHANLMSLVA